MSAHFDTTADIAAPHPDPAEKWLVGLGISGQDGLVWHYYLIDRAADAEAAVGGALGRARLEAHRLPHRGEPLAYEVRRMHQDLFGQWVLLRPRPDDAVLVGCE